MRTIWSVAAAKDKFMCSEAEAVKVVDWKNQHEKIYNRI